MLTETTVSKLREMRLSVMANALKDQFADPQFQSMAFEDRLGLLVDAEWNARKNNHLNKLIRQATFSDPGACLENVEYLPDRGLKQEELLRFGTCNYIQEHHNIILLGATGSGKTYLACALGMAAARRFYAVKYIRLPDLLVEFQIARGNGTIRKFMAQYRKYALLIIDEWLLYPLKETEARDLLEIVESRYKRNSTILNVYLLVILFRLLQKCQEINRSPNMVGDPILLYDRWVVTRLNSNIVFCTIIISTGEINICYSAI